MDAAELVSSIELEPGREPLLTANQTEEEDKLRPASPTGAVPEVGTFNFPKIALPDAGHLQAPAASATTPLSQGASDARMYDLIHAAGSGRVHKVHSLLAQGVDPNAHDYDLRYALHLACAGGHLEVAKVLTEAKADVDVVDNHGFRPMDEAMKNHHSDVIDYLTSQGAVASQKFQNDKRLELLCLAAGHSMYETAIPMTAQERHAQVEKLIKTNKVDVNCEDYHKRTPLHLAVAENNVEMARLLLKLGADPMREDRWKGTAISEAKRHANRTGANEMKDLFPQTGHGAGESSLSMFSVMFVLAEILLIVLMFVCTTYGDSAGGGDEAHAKAIEDDTMSLYSYFQDVNVMIFIGFGYLMTFLRNNAYNSLGLTFLVACLVIQWHFLVGGFFHQAFCTAREGAGSDHCHWHAIPLDLTSMVTADFAAGAVLITYGALLGKVSALQLCCLALLEVVFFAINENIGLVMGITDIGGSMVVHMYGAYFGMGASLVLRQSPGTHDKNAAVYHSDMLAMIGTVFLWMFWPSFNGALGSGVQQHRVVLNSFISLSGSCVAAFLASYIFRGKKFDMVDIQNASLAGGVAMGTAADMILGPGAALLVGVTAGTVSVFGYVHVQPMLENKLGFHDTCGVNNLHGIPSIIGAVAGAIASTQATPALYGMLQLGTTFSSVADGSRTASEQAGQQAKFALITFASSLAAGMISALVVKMGFSRDGPKESHELFTDEIQWIVPHLEEPYFFDKRGEIQRDPTNESEEVNRMTELESKVAELEKALLSIKDGAGSANPAQTAMGSVEELFGRLLQKISPEKRD